MNVGSRLGALLLAIVLGAAASSPLRAQAPPKDVYLPAGESVTLPLARKQTLRFSPRYGNPGSFDLQTVSPGEQRLVYIGGLIINVTYEINTPKGPMPQEYEFAADNLVIWVRGLKGGDLLGGVSVEPAAPGGEKVHIELFLAGNVVVRNREESSGLNGKKTFLTRTIRADQVYYDIDQSKAVSTKADLEMKFDNTPDSVHFTGARIDRLGQNEWHAVRAGVFSSTLPADPSVRLLCGEATMTEHTGERKNIFGVPYRNLLSGEDDYGSIRRIETRNTTVNVLGVPIFYSPYLNLDAAEPLGPLRGLGIGNDRILGTQILTTWDVYKLLALRPPTGHSWGLQLDYLSLRGPGFGSNYSYSGPDFFGFGGPVRGEVKVYGIPDHGVDVLGGFRGPEPIPPYFRGRANWKHQQELFADRDADGVLDDRFLSFSGQFAYLSDKNYFEEYYKQEFDAGLNQETFAYLSGSRGQFYGSILAQGGIGREWLTQTEWLPKLNAAVVGQSFLDDILQYEARGSAGYGKLLPSTVYPPAYINTDQAASTGRFDLYQELSAPFDLGPVRIRPYGILDLTNYTDDLTGSSANRVFGGGGASAALTVSHLYREASSELFNLRGLNHKATFYGNYANVQSNVPYTRLPQLDRLDDDTIDQGLRTIHPYFPLYIPGPDGLALQNSPQFNLQQYAIRRLALDKVDTRDDMEVVQTGLYQRLQTKRGLPGREHTVDWMSLDLMASFFPNPTRDNYGKSAGLLEFNYLWNVGDQTALTASGWFDPFDVATRYWTVGSYIQRPDGMSFYLGYRQTEPLNSKAVTLSAFYQLSKKYSLNVASSYDFGTQLALSNTFTVYRTGTDMTVGLGVTYNALVNNFGVQFVVVPNLFASTGLVRNGTPFAANR